MPLINETLFKKQNKNDSGLALVQATIHKYTVSKYASQELNMHALIIASENLYYSLCVHSNASYVV